MKLRYLMSVFLAGLLCGAGAWLYSQESAFAEATADRPGREIPPHEGPDHPGQPKWCQNYDDQLGYKANCACKRDCNKRDSQHRETGCKTHCRTPACRCNHKCDS